MVRPVTSRILRPIPEGWAWQAEAECRFFGGELFFAPDDKDETAHARVRRERAAKQICDLCAVRIQCLDFASLVPNTYGVWGGTAENDRRRGCGGRKTTAAQQP